MYEDYEESRPNIRIRLYTENARIILMPNSSNLYVILFLCFVDRASPCKLANKSN